MAALASSHSESTPYRDIDPAPDDRAGESRAGVGGDREPVVDLVHLARQTDGDEALERELLDLFERQSARIVAQLRDSRDPRVSGDLAHTLKGSALSMGAGRVARCAHLYEAACAAGLRGGPLAATLDALAEAVAEARATIAGLLV